MILAPPFTAAQCPVCDEWVYVDAPPFAEGDRTKPQRDWLHWANFHADEREARQAAGEFGFPYFFRNDEAVMARFESEADWTKEAVA